MSSSDAGKYLKFIDNFKFREKGAIKLPKTSTNGSIGRDKCYKLSVDVIIESVVTRVYRSYKTIPYSGFYGYATLVKRDCLEEKIPLEFGRNRIFEQRIVEAFQQWQDLAFWLNTTKRFLEVVSEAPANICDIPPFPLSFSEVDLREVYVRTLDLCQFSIEIAWVEPESFTDNCGNSHDGKSKEDDDPTKDNGLPKDGSQPKQNSPSNPYGGNKPISPIPSPYAIDLSGLNGNSGLNGEDPDHTQPIDPNIKYWIRLEGTTKRPSFPNGCAATRKEIVYRELIDGTVTGVITAIPGTPIATGCGSTVVNGWYLTLTGGEPLPAINSDGSPPIISYGSGTEIPADELYYI